MQKLAKNNTSNSHSEKKNPKETERGLIQRLITGIFSARCDELTTLLHNVTLLPFYGTAGSHT